MRLCELARRARDAGRTAEPCSAKGAKAPRDDRRLPADARFARGSPNTASQHRLGENDLSVGVLAVVGLVSVYETVITFPVLFLMTGN